MKNRNSEGLGCVALLVVIFVVGAVALGYSYLIATSDLPDWLKFWLLK